MCPSYSLCTVTRITVDLDKDCQGKVDKLMYACGILLFVSISFNGGTYSAAK